MPSLPISARPLIDPVDGVAAAVESRRWVLPLLVVMACASLSAVALYARWDASPRVVSELTMAGEIARVTEQELIDKINTAERVLLVAGVAKGLFLTPLFALALAVVLKLTGWLLGRKADFGKCFAAGVVALLPVGLYHLIYAVCAFSQAVITDSQMTRLVPSSLAALLPQVGPKAARALAAVDFFNLWSAVLLGLGFASASGMKKGRGVLVGLVLYVLFAAVFLIGLPGMGGGGGK